MLQTPEGHNEKARRAAVFCGKLLDALDLCVFLLRHSYCAVGLVFVLLSEQTHRFSLGIRNISMILYGGLL